MTQMGAEKSSGKRIFGLSRFFAPGVVLRTARLGWVGQDAQDGGAAHAPAEGGMAEGGMNSSGRTRDKPSRARCGP
jgi:hypothetical protein